MRGKAKWLGAAGLLLFGYWLLREPVRQRPPGILISEEPFQQDLPKPEDLPLGEHTLSKLARFRLAARVLGRERYYFDRGAAVSPIDLALGWGPMSDSRVLDQLAIDQYDRWFTYHWSGAAPLPLNEITRNAANMHLIPAADHVATILKHVVVGDLIDLEGFLVRVRDPSGGTWQSSLSRDDTGNGSCEVVYVTAVTVRP